MNNEETPPIPTPAPANPAATLTPIAQTPEALSQTPEENTPAPWVAKEQYDASMAEVEKQRVSETSKNRRIRSFYILLAISGFLLFVMYIGMLIWPVHFYSRGNCSESFIGIAFWLNPLGYLFLLTTGIIGTAIKHGGIRSLGITLIVASPIGWFITGVVIIASTMCGV